MVILFSHSVQIRGENLFIFFLCIGVYIYLYVCMYKYGCTGDHLLNPDNFAELTVCQLVGIIFETVSESSFN